MGRDKAHLKYLKLKEDLIFMARINAQASSTLYCMWDYQTQNHLIVKIQLRKREHEFASSHWEKLQHPNLVPLLRVIDFSDGYVGYLMPLVGVSIKEKTLLSDYGRETFSFTQAKKWIYQLLKAAAYLHQQDLCHLNISCDNAVLSLDGNVKLAGFSQLQYSGEELDRKNILIKSIYSAPEVWENDTYGLSGQEMDVWSLGVSSLEILLGNQFHRKTTNWKTLVTVRQGKGMWKNVMKPLLLKLKSRPYFEKLLMKANPFSKLNSADAEEAYSFVSQFLREEPGSRTKIEEGLRSSFLWPFNKFEVGVLNGNKSKEVLDATKERVYQMQNTAERTSFTIPSPIGGQLPLDSNQHVKGDEQLTKTTVEDKYLDERFFVDI